MKAFLVTVAFIVLGVYMVTTFVLDASDEDTMQGQTKRIGDGMILDMKDINP
jgi:hypothetical protein